MHRLASSSSAWIVVGCLIISAFCRQRPETLATAQVPADTIRCRNIEVVDEAGRVLVSIGASPGGWGLVQTLGSRGKPLVTIGALTPRADVRGAEPSGSIMTHYAEGAMSASLGPDPSGSFGFMLMGPSPDQPVAMISGAPKGGAMMSLGKPGAAQIQLASDVDGKGRPSVNLVNHGHSLATVTASFDARHGLIETYSRDATLWSSSARNR